MSASKYTTWITQSHAIASSKDLESIFEGVEPYPKLHDGTELDLQIAGLFSLYSSDNDLKAATITSD